MNDTELLDLIKSEYNRINPSGCWDFFKNRDRRIPCLPILQKRFGLTYNGILLKAGIPDIKLNFVRRDAQQYLDKLREIIEELGYAPSQTKLIKMGYSPSILIKYFGTYYNAVKQTGHESILNKTPIKIPESNEELLNKYIEFSNELGRPACCSELEKSNLIYSPNVFSIRFGGITNLKEKAGFETSDNNNSQYTQEEIRNILKKYYIKNKRRLRVTEICENKELPALATILKYFETTKINDVWLEIENDYEIIKAMEKEKIKVKIIISNKCREHMKAHINDFAKSWEVLLDSCYNIGEFDNLSNPMEILKVKFPEMVGYSSLVKVNYNDEIVYAKRKGRDVYSKFIKNRKPEITNSVIIILNRSHTNPLEYYLVTMFPGNESIKEPEDKYIQTLIELKQSLEFWGGHALVYDEEIIDVMSIRNYCPYKNLFLAIA